MHAPALRLFYTVLKVLLGDSVLENVVIFMLFSIL